MGNATEKLITSIVKYRVVAMMVCAALLSVSKAGTASGAPAIAVGGVYCQTFDSAVFPGPNGYEIRVFERLCDGWGGSDTVSIVLHSKKSPRDQKIFVYDRMSASPQFPERVDVLPSVTWLNNTEIYILIDMVGDIQLQRELVDGIRVRYSVKSIYACTPEDHKRWGKKCLYLTHSGKSD